mgnify:CR=1 FL=1
MNAVSRGLSRRLILSRSAAVVGASSAGLLLPQIVRAQGNKVRVGFMLPYTGTYAQLGVAIENGVRMAIAEKGGKLGVVGVNEQPRSLMERSGFAQHLHTFL